MEGKPSILQEDKRPWHNHTLGIRVGRTSVEDESRKDYRPTMYVPHTTFDTRHVRGKARHFRVMDQPNHTKRHVYYTNQQ